MTIARCCIPFLMVASMGGCSQSGSGTAAVASSAVGSSMSVAAAGTAAESPTRSSTTLPPLDPADLEDVLPVVCDFERYNGLYVKVDATESNPAGYEQSLDVFVRFVLGDRSLPTDEQSIPQITAERARCDALPNLTFANGSHPVEKQIAATDFRTLVPVGEECSWERIGGDREVVDAATVEAGAIAEIVVDPDDRSVRNSGCGIFVAGTPPIER